MKLSNIITEVDLLEENVQRWMIDFIKGYKRIFPRSKNASDKNIIDAVGGKHRMLRLYRVGTDARKAAMILARANKGKAIDEAKDIDIHREYEAGDAFTSPREKGRVFIILYPFNAAQGVKKWTGIEFVLGDFYPYLASADVTTAGDEQAFKGYKKIKLTSKMKKQIQQVLKDPEEVDRINNSDTKLRDVERAIR